MHGKRSFYCICQLKWNYHQDHLDHIGSLKGRIKRRFHDPFIEKEATLQNAASQYFRLYENIIGILSVQQSYEQYENQH